MLVNIEDCEDIYELEKTKNLLKTYRNKAIKQIEKKCALCGQTLTSFCKSHTVPFSWLKNIDNQQKMLSMYSILDSNWTKQDRGANEAGIFYSICETCDHELFSHYENKSNYKDSLPTKEMLQEIILKICVKEIYENRIAAKQIELLIEDHILEKCYVEVLIAEQETLSTTIKELHRFKNKWPEFRIIYFKKVPYKVPIAYQDQIAVFSDFEGAVINNTYLNNDKIQVLYECILPLESESILLLFTLISNNRYSRFIRNFTSLSEDNKQKTLLYLMFSYSQNYFISNELEEIIKQDDFVKSLAEKLMLGIQESNYELSRIDAHIKTTIETMKSFSLEKAFNLNNYLSETYSLK